MKNTVTVKLTLDLYTAAWLADIAKVYRCSKGRALARHIRELDRKALADDARRRSKALNI